MIQSDQETFEVWHGNKKLYEGNAKDWKVGDNIPVFQRELTREEIQEIWDMEVQFEELKQAKRINWVVVFGLAWFVAVLAWIFTDVTAWIIPIPVVFLAVYLAIKLIKSLTIEPKW